MNLRTLISASFLTLLLITTSAAGAGDTDSPSALARLVADRVLKDYPKPPPFDWGEGVLMAGMMRAGAVLGEPKYIDFAQRWADHWQEYGIEKVLAGDAEKKLTAYCGQWGPGYPVMLLYEKTKDRKYLEMARKIAAFMLTQATRTKEGGLGHWGGNEQLWVDTLYMHGPVLAHLYKADHKSEFRRDILTQVLIYTKHLQDPTSGLYYHMYDDPKETHSPAFWARGNGWVAMTYAEVLPVLSVFDGETARVKGHFALLMKGLRTTQDLESGLWHTVLNRRETYTETSASAMITASFVLGHQRGLLSHKDKAVDDQLVKNAWKGLSNRVDEWGWVFDVSGGTGPGGIEQYASKVTGTYTWGTGAFLIAASAMIP